MREKAKEGDRETQRKREEDRDRETERKRERGGRQRVTVKKRIRSFVAFYN